MSNKKQRTVLIVDDCLEDRETYRRYLLQDLNYEYIILEAELGLEALSMWQEHNLDAILLDYILPDINGVEFIEELQKQTKLTNFPVVMVTGQGDESIAVKAMKTGASDYISKGKTTPKELHLAINSAIDKFNLHVKLQQSQERLQLALDTSTMGTWEWNLQKNSFISSQLLAQVLDIPNHNSFNTYQLFLETIHPEDREIVDRAIKYAIAEKSECRLEFRHFCLDGTIAWIHMRGKVYCNLKNEPLRVIATFTDITESKRQQQERHQFFLKERLLYQIALQVRQSFNLEEILQTTVDRVRNFLDCDRVLIFKFTPDWSVRVVTESVNTGISEILGTEIYDSCFATNWVEKYKDGRVQNIDNIQNGTLPACYIDLLAQFQVQANLVVPILESDNLWGLIIVHQCYTPRKWHGSEINLLKQLATQVGIAIQQSTLFNQVRIELNERKQAQQALQDSLQRQQILRKEAETANRLKDDFLSVISHELRTPLNPILGWSTILLQGKLDVSRQIEALQIIARNAKVQSQLIEELLDFSRVLRGKLQLKSEPVDLINVIFAALETVRLSAEAKNVNLKFLINISSDSSSPNWLDTSCELKNCQQIKLSHTQYFVLGDTGKLQQTIWNLLANAVKFTPRNESVTIKLEAIENQAIITVIDTGIGIEREFLPHVFDYFRQADSSTTRQFGGLGLGLAIVRYLIEMHGGSVKADSLGKDKGAIFTVSLQLLELRQTTQNNTTNLLIHEIKPQNLQGLRILVVDDEPDSLDFVSFVLEQDGANVIKAASAIEALKLFPDLQPDILVTDIGMPEINGYMLISQIRAMQPQAGANIPAIALTGYAGEDDREQALSMGFQRHVTKPVEPDLLIATVIELTRNSSKLNDFNFHTQYLKP
jgi:signal transduction histidine kinase/DNA-binding response OmpR family regulator